MKIEFINVMILPSPTGQFQPCPELLTEQEAVWFLRLDVDGPENPGKTLAYYRNKKLLRATRVGRKLRYRRVELLKLLEKLTERTAGADNF